MNEADDDRCGEAARSRGGRSSGMSHEWTNRALHSQVAHFIRRVLPHLDNVAKLDVDIEGEKVAWNKEP
ncbi:MAG TPA: hypothetical protein VF403_26835 [Kofleriaceae bacterium]